MLSFKGSKEEMVIFVAHFMVFVIFCEYAELSTQSLHLVICNPEQGLDSEVRLPQPIVSVPKSGDTDGASWRLCGSDGGQLSRPSGNAEG